MSIFLRRNDDSDLRARIEALEVAHRALAREHEALRADHEEKTELLMTLLGVDLWLREGIERAKASGWLVSCSPNALVFERPEGSEHTYRVPIPLLENRVRVVRHELTARVLCFDQLDAA
jgi:hypothetical protein